MRATSSGSVLDMLEGVFSLGIKLCAAAILLVTGYYVYATVAANNPLFRGMLDNGQFMNVPQFKQHVQNMQLLTRVLTFASLGLILCTLGKYYGYVEAAAALFLVGAIMFLGMPFLIDSAGGPTGGLHPLLAKIGNPREYLRAQYQFVGLMFGAVGGIHLLVHAVIFVAGMRQRRPKPNEEAARTAASVRKPKDKFLGLCWELPFCRDTEKELCPIRATKKPCWRTGRGCYCDQNVILTLSGGNQYSAARGSAGYLSRTATVVKPKSLREKREQCLGCPVYLHHQSQKYTILAPGSLILTIGLIVYFWANIQTLYPSLVLSAGRAFSSFSFGSTVGGVPSWATELATNQPTMWMMLIVVTMLMLAYLLHGVEWVLYKLGI